MQDAPLFELQDVSKTFPLARPYFPFGRKRSEIRAVSNVSLQINHGEVFGVIGESGSGKSTLGFLMGGIERPSSGSMMFCGKALDAMDRRDRNRFCRTTQLVFQDLASALNPRRKVRAALRDSLRLAGVPRVQRDGAVKSILHLVGLSDEHGLRYPHQLSGGQRQRVGIARALAMEPSVLIADEPVSALDVSVQAQIINLLLDLREKLNLSIVLISHDIAVVAHSTDRVAVMRQGEIVEMGVAHDVIHSPQHPYTRALISAVPKGLAARGSAHL